MIDLKNKKVLITGATGGIGGSLVKKFLSLNAEVLGTGTKSDKLEKLKNEFNKIKVKKFDISAHSEIEKFIYSKNILDINTLILKFPSITTI